MKREFPFLSKSCDDALSEDKFGRVLHFGDSTCIRIYDTVDSTFTVAERLVKQNALRNWDSIIAVEQTKGIGQHGRQWISDKGNLHATIKIPKQAPFTSMSASPALGGMLASALCSLGLTIWIKWPNDLIIADPYDKIPYRKVGGILIRDFEDSILAGVGINISNHPNDTSMRSDHAFPAGNLPDGELFPKNIDCIIDLWTYLTSRMREIFDDEFAKKWRVLANSRLISRGKNIEVNEDGECPKHFVGKLLEIDESGGLKILTSSGIEICMTGSMFINGE